MNIILPLIPLLLIRLFCLFPSPCSILIIQIAITNIFDLCNGLPKLCSWQYFAGLVLNFIWFFYDWVATEDNRTWTIGFLGHVWADRFITISRTWSRWLWFLPSPDLGVYTIVSVLPRLTLLTPCFGKGAWRHLIYYKNPKILVWLSILNN